MTYTVGDVFLGCPASFTGQPYHQPTVLHYEPDGVTLIDTLIVPVGPAVNEAYQIYGVAVGADGRCYVLWHTGGSASPPVPARLAIDVFDAGGTWVSSLVDLGTDYALLIALPGGDLATAHHDSGGNVTIDRWQVDGTNVGSWAAPVKSTNLLGFALAPGQTEQALLLLQNDAYVISLADGSVVSGPTAVPLIDPLNYSVWTLLSSTTAPYLVIKDYSSADAAWRIYQLSAALSTAVGAAAELAAESFPGGGISHYGLQNVPWDVAVNGAGDAGWAVTYTTDSSHSGASADSTFRTGLRRTVMPGGTSVAVQSDVNGDTNLVYVYQGFASCDEEMVTDGLTLWVEASSLTASDGDVIDPWTEAGTLTIGGADDLVGDPSYAPTEAGTYQAAEVCGEPVVQFDAVHFAYATTGRVGLAYGTAAPALFNDLGQFSVAALLRIASGSDTSADLVAIRTDVLWLYLENFGDGTGQVNLRVNQNAAFQTITFDWYPYTVGEWALVVVRWDGTTVRATLNGAEEQTAAFSAPLQSTEVGAGAPVLVGFDSDPVDQVGQIALLATWNRYLTTGEDNQLRTGYLACRYPCLDFGAPVAPPALLRRRSRVGLLK